MPCAATAISRVIVRVGCGEDRREQRLEFVETFAEDVRACTTRVDQAAEPRCLGEEVVERLRGRSLTRSSSPTVSRFFSTPRRSRFAAGSAAVTAFSASFSHSALVTPMASPEQARFSRGSGR